MCQLDLIHTYLWMSTIIKLRKQQNQEKADDFQQGEIIFTILSSFHICKLLALEQPKIVLIHSYVIRFSKLSTFIFIFYDMGQNDLRMEKHHLSNPWQ